jgi:hypothetical protein
MNADQEKIKTLPRMNTDKTGLVGFGKTKLPPLIFTDEH